MVCARFALPFTLAALALCSLLPSCSKSPAEPDNAPEPASAPAGNALRWDKPASWTTLPTPPSGPKKATYRITETGNDKEDSELNVYFFGTGGIADPEKNFKEWLEQFDGDPASIAKREGFDVHGMKVETVELSGTYKLALGPAMGPQKKSPVQMVKKGWRLHGAVVKTPDRGNWFFKLTGPDDTVQSARSAFRTLLESVR